MEGSCFLTDILFIKDIDDNRHRWKNCKSLEVFVKVKATFHMVKIIKWDTLSIIDTCNKCRREKKK